MVIKIQFYNIAPEGAILQTRYLKVVWPSGLRRLIQESLISSPREAGVLRYRKMQEFESLSNHIFIFLRL